MMPTEEELNKEFTFKTSRSGGKGGQNVNKVESKVELIFNVANSQLFTEEEKVRLFDKLSNKLDSEFNLHIISQEDRSQLLNKQRTVEKIIDLLSKALIVQKKRRPTKIPKAVIQKRLANKAVVSTKKESRKRPNLD